MDDDECDKCAKLYYLAHETLTRLIMPWVSNGKRLLLNSSSSTAPTVITEFLMTIINAFNWGAINESIIICSDGGDACRAHQMGLMNFTEEIITRPCVVITVQVGLSRPAVTTVYL